MFSAIIVSLLLLFTQGKEPIAQIRLGQTVPDQKILDANGYRFYQLPMHQDYEDGKDLIVKVLRQDLESDPDIYISKTNERPKTGLDSEWACAFYGKDTCTIHHRNISQDDIFYIGVLCSRPICNYEIKTLLTDEYELEDGKEFQTYFEKDDAKIFKFKIPQQVDQNSSVTIKASPFRSNVHDFTLTLKGGSSGKGDAPSTDFQSRVGVPAWKKGQVIRISPDDQQDWCPGCVVDILLDVVDSGYYHIVAQSNEAVPLLQNGVQQDDVVSYNQNQCYKYFVKSETTDFQVSLTTYSGKVDIKVNPLNIPENWQDFLITRESELDSIIDIRPWTRKHHDAPKGIYYVCVHGDLSSTYTLRVREYDQDQRHALLEEGYSENFYLKEQDMHVHPYHVPKADFTGEKMKIEVNVLVKRGSRPVLGASMCSSESIEQCVQEFTYSQVISQETTLVKANDNGQVIKLLLDHNETECQQRFNGDCYYAIALANPSAEYPSLYQITAFHSQKNHILLQEGQPYIDSVEMHQYKYYKYTILDASQVQNVTFQMSPLHGDSDLYISRYIMFPNKTHNEKMSMRIGSFSDHIEFSKADNGSLAETYYIAVYGYAYASYSILAHINREGESIEDKLKSSITHLYEGVPLQKSLHNEFDQFVGFFEVNINEDDDRAIVIDLANTLGKTHSYIKYGEVGSRNNKDFELIDGVLKIMPGHPAYHKQGAYFVTTHPNFQLLNLFRDNYYSFRLKWSLESDIMMLNSHDSLTVQTEPHSYTYLRHYLLETQTDIKISLVGGGHLDMFISIDPHVKKPNEENFNFTTKFQRGGNFSNSKSLFLPFQLLEYFNPSCADLGYASEEPCVLYIGLYCNEDSACEGQIELEYENYQPKKISAGVTKHSAMAPNSYTYYYLTINKDQLADVYSVLNPLHGETDMYVNLQRDQQDISNWDLPTADNYRFKSKKKLDTDIIHLTVEDLKLCFQSNATKDEECIVVFGLYARPSQTKDEQIMFNFAAYKDILELKVDQPATGYVQEGKFSYFFYESKCDNCSITLSLSSYSNGDPDLYVNKDLGLPDKADYDMKAATLHSEIMTINQDTEFIKSLPDNTMKGYFMIGVYGNKNTTFSLSITSQENGMPHIYPGLSLKQSQQPFELNYFQYYNWHSKDIEIALDVSQGSADLYVNSFSFENPDENYVDMLPTSKRNSIWHVDDINSMNQIDGKEILIMNQDRNYCTDCIYLIGVVTHDKMAQYRITLNTLEAEKTSPHLLKLGEVKMTKFTSSKQQKIYQFMLESKERVHITPTLISGKVAISLGLEESTENAIHTQQDDSAFTIEAKELLTEQNYYIIVESLSDSAELSLTINQRFTILTLQDGIPQKIKYSDKQDASKYLLYNIPAGTSTVMVNIKSKTQNFFPTMYYRVFDKSISDSLVFPPTELYSFDKLGIKQWDKDLYVMRGSLEFVNQSAESSLAINLKYNKRKYRSQKPSTDADYSGEAIITMSSSKIIKLVPGEDYFGELQSGEMRYALFKIEPPEGMNVVIEYSNCMGFSSFSVIKDPTNFKARIKTKINRLQGKQQALVTGLKGAHYILVEPITFGQKDDTIYEYMIQVHYTPPNYRRIEAEFLPMNGGHIEYQLDKNSKGKVNIQWGPLYQIQEDKSTGLVENVRYQLVTSRNPKVVMDSVCAAKRNEDVYKVMKSVDKTSQSLSNIDLSKELYLNVIAISGDGQVTVPYKPITLYVPYRSAFDSSWAVGVFVILFLVLGVAALYFYLRGKKLQEKIEIEMRDVTVGDTGVNTYRRVAKPAANYNNFAEEQD